MTKEAPFSSAARARDLAEMSRNGVELLVVGGGITGVGVAREAALRGLSVALVERADFAAGTSSRSSKLIHGGVRYLQQGDVALVVEAAEERRILRRIAPHLTQPRPMMVPAYGVGTHTKLNVGLWTYEKLAKVPPAERHEMLDREGTLAREPGLRREGLTGAAVYPENLTDDARLVLATARSARRAGALLANYAEVTKIDAADGGSTVTVVDRESGAPSSIRARVIVNAAGPWCDSVRSLEGAIPGKRLHLTKGIHFAVLHADLPLSSMVVMQARDRRSVFAIPRDRIVYVGTTDTDYGAAVEYPEVTRDDVEYLLEAVRRHFPAATWGLERVVSAWAGLRPLIHEEGKKPSEISRRDELTEGPYGMISVAGGKLTTFRRTAEKVVELVEHRLGRRAEPASGGSEQPLDGGDLPMGSSPQEYARFLVSRFGANLPGLEDAVDRLVLLYGTNAEALLGRAIDRGLGFFPGSVALRAEVERAVLEEMSLRLTDVLERRLRLLLFDPERGLDVAAPVAEQMASLLGWSEERMMRELDEYRETAKRCMPI